MGKPEAAVTPSSTSNMLGLSPDKSGVGTEMVNNSVLPPEAKEVMTLAQQVARVVNAVHLPAAADSQANKVGATLATKFGFRQATVVETTDLNLDLNVRKQINAKFIKAIDSLMQDAVDRHVAECLENPAATIGDLYNSVKNDELMRTPLYAIKPYLSKKDQKNIF
jgi:hypothetical protein